MLIPAEAWRKPSLLALKLVGIRRVCHVDDLAADPGAGLFAGLSALPKATALSTYSYRLGHQRQAGLLAALGKAMLGHNLITDAGGDLDLDFHAIMHWGEDVALEKNYVPARSQRTRSVLTFFAQDASSDTLVYANADLTKVTQSGEVLVFAGHWRALTGRWPALLVMDQKVTTQPVLAELHARGRLPHPADALPGADPPHRGPAALRLAHRPAGPRRRLPPPPRRRRGGHPVRLPRHRPSARRLRPQPRRPHRHHHLDRTRTAKQIIERYARRMSIEQRLAASIRSFPSTSSPAPSRSTSTSTSRCPCSPTPSAPRYDAPLRVRLTMVR